MKRHELKCHPGPFAAMRAELKAFEYRKDDRDYEVGDVLVLQEWSPKADHPDGGFYTGAPDLIRIVTYIARDAFGIPPGYCVMSVWTRAEEEAQS